MSQINMAKAIAGGLVAGLVVNVAGSCSTWSLPPTQTDR